MNEWREAVPDKLGAKWKENPQEDGHFRLRVFLVFEIFLSYDML